MKLLCVKKVHCVSLMNFSSSVSSLGIWIWMIFVINLFSSKEFNLIDYRVL